ncbi:uncharacterized protein METZ01_LOCUS158276 [marine metagenome]|uniref:Uncharacterized protein n=1 Tax=marine metagenome TaxID=408172 RepID=A0A382AWJ6_9ZZZZ
MQPHEMFGTANRFEALGVFDLHHSPLYMKPKALAEALFKEGVHHSENTAMQDFEKIQKIIYYVDLGRARNDMVSEYDSDFWRHYLELLEREMNRIPDAEEQDAIDALNELTA